MAGGDFRYDLSTVPAYFAEYYKAFNDWQDSIAHIPADEYEKQIISRNYSSPAWQHEREYLTRRNAALNKMTDIQVIELIEKSEPMDKMLLSAYLMRRQNLPVDNNLT